MKNKITHGNCRIALTNKAANKLTLKSMAQALMLVFASLSFSTASFAVPLSLSQVPDTAGNRPPAPNFIVSADNSGSMGECYDPAGVAKGYPNTAAGCAFENPTWLSGLDSLKQAMLIAFSQANLADNKIRLGYQSMHGQCRNVGAPGVGCTNRIKSLSGTHRTNFLSWVNSIQLGGGTPTHTMMNNVGNYMDDAPGINSPWAADPGTTELPYLACRKTFHLVMTDGGWNGGTVGGGNTDGTFKTLPETIQGFGSYTPFTANTMMYSDTFGTNATTTLADMAFRQWSTDMQPTLSNVVEAVIKESGTTTVGGVALPEFWNPKNNPATWQHVSTYTIGFGGATTWPGDPLFGTNTYDGDYPSLVNGSKTWQNPLPAPINDRSFELWHMALNGRGKFVPASSPATLVTAFNDILGGAILDSSAPLTSIAANSGTVSSGSRAFVSGYNGLNWTGKVLGYNLTADGDIAPNAIWSAAERLDSKPASFANTRTVISYNGTDGVPFLFNSLNAQQQIALNATDNLGEFRVDYLRGDKSKELNQPNGVFRNRDSLLGDVVNSHIWQTSLSYRDDLDPLYIAFLNVNKSRVPMVYVGANDGMLHGFDANTGEEKLAYVPAGFLIPNAQAKINSLTESNFVHQFFADGSPFTGDAFTTGWKTFLVSGFGAGAKGYTVLDVTNPNSINETNASSVVVADTTVNTDPDIGHIFSQPVTSPDNGSLSSQIVKLNNGKWAVVMGNGYNSTNERAALVVQYLDGTASPAPIIVETIIGTGNGLAAPALIDLNADGMVDVAYAGDLKGRMWKFDLSSATQGVWNVAFNGQPLFTTATGLLQPITSAPTFKPHPLGGVMLAFGTGRKLTDADRLSAVTQAVYAVYDKTPINPASGGKIAFGTGVPNIPISSLVQQTQTVFGTGFKTTANPVTYSGAGSKNGWYMNFVSPGMRVINNASDFFDRRFLIQSSVPANGGVTEETCDPASTADNFLSVFDIFTTNDVNNPIFVNGAAGQNTVKLQGAAFVKINKSNVTKFVTPTPGGGGGSLSGAKPEVPFSFNPATGGWRELP